LVSDLKLRLRSFNGNRPKSGFYKKSELINQALRKLFQIQLVERPDRIEKSEKFCSTTKTPKWIIETTKK